MSFACFITACGATVQFTALDSDTDKPLPCRVHLKDAPGKPVRPKGLPFWHDHFVCAGSVGLDLVRGTYAYEIDRGPEYPLTTGTVAVADSGSQAMTSRLRRLLDLAKEGWWPASRGWAGRWAVPRRIRTSQQSWNQCFSMLRTSKPALASASLITLWAGGQQFSRNHSRAHSTSRAVEVTADRKLEVAAVISGF